MLRKKPPDGVLEYLAAAPLEDLIAYHDLFFVDRIELQARQDPAFERLLGGVWQNATPLHVWRRMRFVQRGRGS